MTFEDWWEQFSAEHEDWRYADSEALRKAAFKAGVASRDADIHRLQMALADTEALELGTSEKCDQLREQVALLREALKGICSDYEDRFDMGSPSTNPGMKFVVKQAREALDATEPKS